MHLQGYSDRIHHALAFAAKHYPARVSRYDRHSCLIRASSVAVILARFGADECTIVSSILKLLYDSCTHGRQQTLGTEIGAKFGVQVAHVVEAAAEPKYDVLGRERTWKACRFEYLARLMTAPSRAMDVCVADELHAVGAALVEIRRLGVEYHQQAGVPNGEDTSWWHRGLIDLATSHPTWNRLEMLIELKRITRELNERFDSRGLDA
ncbi:MAG: HD domain-containing protein [Gemmatimonadota bacterium]